jgi:hypothetical protein
MATKRSTPKKTAAVKRSTPKKTAAVKRSAKSQASPVLPVVKQGDQLTIASFLPIPPYMAARMQKQIIKVIAAEVDQVGADEVDDQAALDII